MLFIFFIFFCILLLLEPIQGNLLCHVCDNFNPDCAKDPQFLIRCPEGTKMCYYRAYGQFFNRGCLYRKNPAWNDCAVLRSNRCITCYGIGCNHMDYQRPSDQYCIQCKGKACETLVEGKRCQKPDTPFGPTKCVTKYDAKVQHIELKDCWTNIDQKSKEYTSHKNLYFTCTGAMCNYQSVESLMRCVKFRGLVPKFKRTVGSCFVDKKPALTALTGCFRDWSRRRCCTRGRFLIQK